MSKVYAIWGSTGEYSDHSEWPVCYYADRESADKHAAALNEAVKTWPCDYEEHSKKVGDIEWYDIQKKWGEALGDPSLSIDYTGTSYFVVELTLGVLPVKMLSFQEWKAQQSRAAAERGSDAL